MRVTSALTKRNDVSARLQADPSSFLERNDIPSSPLIRNKRLHGRRYVKIPTRQNRVCVSTEAPMRRVPTRHAPSASNPSRGTGPFKVNVSAARTSTHQRGSEAARKATASRCRAGTTERLISFLSRPKSLVPFFPLFASPWRQAAARPRERRVFPNTNPPRQQKNLQAGGL